MKATRFLVTGATVLALACSSSGGEKPPGSGGTGGSVSSGGTGGTPATGGATGASVTGGSGGGGVTGTGGTPATGGTGGSATTGGASGSADAGSPDGAAAAANSLAGTYGNMAIKPIISAFWLGKPANLEEGAGGPFVVLLSAPVTCAELSKSRGWIATIPAGTQVMELIIGTTEVGKELSEKDGAGAGKFEVNYMFGANKLMEYKGASGTLSLTAYTPGKAVDGMLDVKFVTGSTAKGTFHAEWCPEGQEVGAP